MMNMSEPEGTAEYDDEVRDGLYFRQTLFDKSRRVVIKVGSAILAGETGINRSVIDNLAREISFLKNSGREVILVTSGAVAAGRQKLGVPFAQAVSMPEKQALAAVGQSVLMQVYEEAFAENGQEIGQVLLTHSDLANRNRYLNVRNTIHALFRYGVIPVINENDTVSIEELRFGDNDNLGALISNLIEADMFICLTDVIGLYNGNPHTDPQARPIYTVSEVTPEIEAMAGNVKSALGTGGMQSKIRAAKLVAQGGGSSFIGPGRQQEVLQKLFSGEMVGTFFLPAEHKVASRKRWIANVLKPKGHIIVDDGAHTALTRRGRSLLPSGIVEIGGKFEAGDPVEVLDCEKSKIGIGLVNYDSDSIGRIKGLKSDLIESELGYKDSDEVIHRDNMVISL